MLWKPYHQRIGIATRNAAFSKLHVTTVVTFRNSSPCFSLGQCQVLEHQRKLFSDFVKSLKHFFEPFRSRFAVNSSELLYPVNSIKCREYRQNSVFSHDRFSQFPHLIKVQLYKILTNWKTKKKCAQQRKQRNNDLCLDKLKSSKDVAA